MHRAQQPLVLVTGASGFIGRQVATLLSSQGWPVRASARNLDAVPCGAGIEPAILHDLAGPADWRRLTEGVTHVVHLAGMAQRSRGVSKAAQLRINAEAAGELARESAAAGVKRFIFVSSVRAQSGPSYPGVLCEDTEACPTDDYGRSKLAGEALVSERKPDAVILRPVIVYGPGAKGSMAALSRAAALPLPLPFRSLNERRSVLSVRNLAEAIRFSLAAPDVRGQTYLVADAEPRTVRELVSLMRAGLGRRPGLFGVPPRLLVAAGRLTGRVELLERLLGGLEVDTGKLNCAGWQPAERTEDALRDMMLERLQGS